MRTTLLMLFALAILMTPLGLVAETGTVFQGNYVQFANVTPSIAASAFTANHVILTTLQSDRDDNDQGRDNRGKGNNHKDKHHKKDFHGAEMTPAAILIAGLLAISAYVFIARRRTQRHV